MIISDLNTLEVVEANNVVGGAFAAANVSALAIGPSAIVAATNSNAASGSNLLSEYNTASSGTVVFGLTSGGTAINTSSVAAA